MAKIALYIPNENDAAVAEKQAQALQLPICSNNFGDYDILLSYADEQWFLRDANFQNKKNSLGDFKVDFLHGATRHRFEYGGGKGQAIAKAVGLNQKKALKVFDCTAGFGGDAFVLASLGCEVFLFEKNPIVFFLLNQALEYAKKNCEQGDKMYEVLQAIHCQHLNGVDALSNFSETVDVVYLDPMFPHREKSSKVKKNMQYLQRLLHSSEQIGQTQNEQDEALLAAALNVDCARVVVKRPAHAPEIKNAQMPSYSLQGKSTRYDIYALRKLN